MTHYIHHINPILIHIHGPLAIRWYGISYLLGFLSAFLLLRRWSRQGAFQVPETEVGNFMTLLAFWGVFIGGRLGYVLFYGLDALRADPLFPFKIWQGGMASHGGLIGVILFMLWYARKNHYAFWNISDQMAATASLGILFGRIANFINGELWGRPTSVPWGVVFPEETGIHYEQYSRPLIQQLLQSGDLCVRHPSQLYQAACEGGLVFLTLLILRRTPWGKRPGSISAAFLILYAIARIGVEYFREPDSTIYFGWMTKGQLYSLFMLLGGILILGIRKIRAFSSQPTDEGILS